MGTARKPEPVKLIAGFIYGEQGVCDAACAALIKAFGPVDAESPVIPFEHTDYYAAEFGARLSKKLVSFSRLISPGEIAGIKLRTNSVEKKLARDGRRRVNIDPGYLGLPKLVLATTKDFAHRIYIAKGIYAEVTLVFRDNAFAPFPWTYPDYKTKEYTDFLHEVRRTYVKQIAK